MTGVFFLKGRLDAIIFHKFCEQNHIDPKRTVFIFPGNLSHHTAGNNLYSKKFGGGLAAVATELAEEGIPTLSLPTTGMHELQGDTPPELAQRAIADLWRVIGFDFNIALPIRPHINNIYFDDFFSAYDGSKVELSFWGGIESASNKSLANYYLAQIKFMQDFIEKNNQEYLNKLKQNKLYFDAYTEGRTALSDLRQRKRTPHWFMPLD